MNPSDLIIVLIIVVLVALGIRSTVKHFSGKGGCCGGGDYKVKKKRLSNVKYKKIFSVEGMHCENCRKRVEEVINDMPGLAGSVDLKKNQLTVSYEEEVEDEVITARLDRAGYPAAYVQTV
ncbi:MAG: heavy metal-associated domain-containing protein [Eubacteriales bacterium]|nr:heavy metal-associated domain-containing protein [Eubacteriales bacterium]